MRTKPFPMEVNDLPTRQFKNIFYKKQTKMNCFSGQTWAAAKHWGRLTYHIRYYLQKKTFGKSGVLAVLQSVQGKNWVLSRMFKGAS